MLQLDEEYIRQRMQYAASGKAPVPQQPSDEFVEMQEQMRGVLAPITLPVDHPNDRRKKELDTYKVVSGHTLPGPRRSLVVIDFEQALGVFNKRCYTECLNEFIRPYLFEDGPSSGQGLTWWALMFWKYSLLRAMILPLGWMNDHMKKAETVMHSAYGGNTSALGAREVIQHQGCRVEPYILLRPKTMYAIVDEEVYRRNELKDYENARAIIAVPTQELKDLRKRYSSLMAEDHSVLTHWNYR